MQLCGIGPARLPKRAETSDILTRLGEAAMPVNPPDPIHTLRATDFQGLAE